VVRPSVIVLDDHEAMSRAAADLVIAIVAARPTASVVVPTGETPMDLYRELARRREQGALDASGVRAYQLDEYVGIDPDDRRSFFGWMTRAFTEPLGIRPEHVVRLPADGNLVAACAAYDRAVEETGGFDLVLLGIGANGHIGFNEPPCDASAPTREVVLSAETVRSNARYWGDAEHVPPSGVTIGMAPLLRARKILLLASGAHKREVVHRALEGPVTPQVPASYLQEAPDVTVFADREAWIAEASGAGGTPSEGGRM
jgi:glucosamine-6-phosphate deaminase